MDFEKYQHVERFGSVETEGIEDGYCWVFPKIDGTNGQLYCVDGLVMAGSRNRVLTSEDDNAGFYAWSQRQDHIKDFFRVFPSYRLYGEWLVPHSLRTYSEDAWRRFYVFDVVDQDGQYIPYEGYKFLMDEHGIDYIPPICKIRNPSYEKLLELLDKNVFLIQDGKGTGEGIVIKNYEYRNRFGRQTWAKIVKNEFKALHSKTQVTEVNDKKLIEQSIVYRYVTLALVEKEYAKIVNDCGWSSQQIPRLLNTVYYCLVKEECWNFVKEFKNPTVDFKRLFGLSTQKVKELMPNLF